MKKFILLFLVACSPEMGDGNLCRQFTCQMPEEMARLNECQLLHRCYGGDWLVVCSCETVDQMDCSLNNVCEGG